MALSLIEKSVNRLSKLAAIGDVANELSIHSVNEADAVESVVRYYGGDGEIASGGIAIYSINDNRELVRK